MFLNLQFAIINFSNHQANGFLKNLNNSLELGDTIFKNISFSEKNYIHLYELKQVSDDEYSTDNSCD